jgi:hypothetical protein
LPDEGPAETGTPPVWRDLKFWLIVITPALAIVAFG